MTYADTAMQVCTWHSTCRGFIVHRSVSLTSADSDGVEKQQTRHSTSFLDYDKKDVDLTPTLYVTSEENGARTKMSTFSLPIGKATTLGKRQLLLWRGVALPAHAQRVMCAKAEDGSNSLHCFVHHCCGGVD